MTAQDHQSRALPVLARVWLVFGLVAGAGVSLLAVPAVAAFLNGDLARIVARMTADLLTLLGTPTSVDGARIVSGGFVGEIIAACTPIYPAILLTAAVLAYPAPVRAKLWGLALGLPALFLINEVRIVTLIAIGRTFPQHFDVAHYLVWQALIIFAAVALWLVWMGRVNRHEAV